MSPSHQLSRSHFIFSRHTICSCPTTYAKTVELLCTNWLKSTKFDPIALLDQLNPVLNENVCQKAAEVLLRVASAIDCEDTKEPGVELVRKHLGAPEIRELRGTVLRRMNVVDAAAAASATANQDDGDNENEKENEGDDEAGTEKKQTMSSLGSSVALFLRVKCESAAAANRPEAVSDIITDIPRCATCLTRTSTPSSSSIPPRSTTRWTRTTRQPSRTRGTSCASS